MARGTVLPPAPVSERTRRLTEARVRIAGEVSAAQADVERAHDEFNEAAMRHYIGECDDATLEAVEIQLAEAEQLARRLDAGLQGMRSRLPGV